MVMAGREQKNELGVTRGAQRWHHRSHDPESVFFHCAGRG
jgi:hypothetical protein